MNFSSKSLNTLGWASGQRLPNVLFTGRTKPVGVVHTQLLGNMGVVARLAIDAKPLVVVSARLQHVLELAVFFIAAPGGLLNAVLAGICKW